MNHRKIIIGSVLLVASATPIAAERPGDSVTNGMRRGATSVTIENGSGHTALLTNVVMASQTDLDHFVEYGPFINRSSATLKIRLVHIGGSRRHTVAGMIGDRVVSSHPDSMTFEVAPGERYSLLAKDYASISAAANKNGVEYSSTGLPREVDFLRPSGHFLRCIEVVEPNTQMLEIYYFYASGTMTDASQRRDYISDVVPGVTGGARPYEGVVCERKDSFW